MSRLQLIEQNLLTIDSAGFQNLCDAYLTRRTQEIRSLNRSGSQIGKQKTIKGTPDTFFRLEDGRLQFVEYTTQAENIVTKIKEDLDKCINEDKIGIPRNEVDKVVFCFNSRLTLEEERELTLYARDKGVDVDLLGIDNLAMEINSKHLILARDFLEIPLDTGQILSLKDFIGEYNNKAGGLATPLDNEFFHRESELSDIGNRLNVADLLIISGTPGVGKTKIALEAIFRFLDNNLGYEAFAVSKKDVDISADLRLHLESDRDYILLVDDANRQLINFKQILGVFREKRKGNIKLVITIRDYATNDIINECAEYKYEKIEIGKFTDEEIKAILESDAFEIRNHKYQNKITEIADGNARLAIMGARLAISKQREFLYGSVFELYDSYFQTFTKDNSIFQDDAIIKALGLVSFFFTINRENKAFIEKLLSDFELDYYNFNEAINELERRELLEIKYSHVRVSEQVMSTYYFYKVFIKDKALSFKTLLLNYFPKWERRFKDTVIPANNTFGYREVLSNINAYLNEYLASLNNDQERDNFFSMFWFYKSSEMLSFLHDKIMRFPEPPETEYVTDYNDNDYLLNRDEVVGHLSKLFAHNTEHFVPSLALGLEYARRSPDRLPLIVKNIRETIIFSDDDEYDDFGRQRELFRHIIENLPQEHYKQAFFALSSTFLAHHYQVHRSTRGNKITFYEYPLPVTDTIKHFRTGIWKALFDLFDASPDNVIAVLSNFTQSWIKPLIPELLESDLELIVPFIDGKLQPDNIKHEHFVHEFVRRIKSKNNNHRFKEIKTKFHSDDYLAYRKLDWNYIKGKQEYDFDDTEEFEKLKEADLKQSFVFRHSNEFTRFHKAIKHFQLLEKESNWMLQKSVDFVLRENYTNDREIGYSLFRSYLDNYPGINYTPVGFFDIVIRTSQDDSRRLWEMLTGWEHPEKPYWLLYFVYRLPKDYINSENLSTLKDFIKNVQTPCTIYLNTLEDFFTENKSIFLEIVQLIVARNRELGNKISVGFHFFEKFSSYFEGYEDLLGLVYIQQENCEEHHDYDGKDLAAVIKIYPQVLFEFVEEFYTRNTLTRRKSTEKKMAFVWDIENGEQAIEKVFEMITDTNTYIGIMDYPLIVFFNGLSPSQTLKAKDFVLNYISKHNTDVHRMNAIFDTIHRSKMDFFEPALLHFLSQNTDIKLFQEIEWVANPGVINGDQLFGEIEAQGWEIILAITEKHSNKLDLIPIKGYIKRRIELAHQRAEEERKEKYIDPRNWA